MRASWAFACLAVAAASLSGSAQQPPGSVTASPVEFIDTSIENASPLWYDVADGVVRIHLIYDHERAAPNRAAGHVHFLLNARPGTKLTLEFLNLDNVWNGQPGSVAGELKTMALSEDGRVWRTVPTDSLPGNRVQLQIDMRDRPCTWREWSPTGFRTSRACSNRSAVIRRRGSRRLARPPRGATSRS